MNKFKTFDDVMRQGEAFRKGQIIPQRILKGPRKLKHQVIFGCDCWAFCTPKGYIVFNKMGENESAARITNIKNQELLGSPYTPGGTTCFLGAFGMSDDEHIASCNGRMSAAKSFSLI